MRLPFEPDAPHAPENKAEPTASSPTTDKRDPSYPDRARIDSDVRAFLRPVSSPWIVFDRDSKVEDDFAKSALRVGAVFASSPSLLPEPRDLAEAMSSGMGIPAATPQTDVVINEMINDRMNVNMNVNMNMNMFPPSLPNEMPVVEPSNVVVAKDVTVEPQPRSAIESDPFAVPGLVPNRKLPLMIAGGALGVLAIAAVVALSVGGRHHIIKQAPLATNAAVQAPAAAETAAVVVAPPTPAAPTPATAIVEIDQPAVAPAAAPPSSPADHKDEGENSKDPKKRFGKLTIKADAAKAGKMVWFDGKRMIGVGQRSYLVFCGMHTVAVADKTDTKDVEIPCNGEYSLSK